MPIKRFNTGENINGFIFIKDTGTIITGSQTKRTALFKCHCSNIFNAVIPNILSKNTKSCGCGKYKIKHGHNTLHPSVTYQTWAHMKNRCNCKNNNNYPNYGGRGIKVCDRWNDSFINFLNDMGERPSKKHSLDRIDVNGDYTPENCRWATMLEQANNKRHNVWIEYKGEKMTASQWARKVGISASLLLRRYRMWDDLDRVFNEPYNYYKNNHKQKYNHQHE